MSTRIAIIALAALAGTAVAGPTGLAATTGPNQGGAGLDPVGATLQNLGGMLGGGGGFTDDPEFPALHPTSHQSLSLRVLGAGSAQGFANSLGDVVVQVNTGFQSLGTNTAGKQILGQVRQYFTPDNKEWIEVEYKTADGAPLVPVNMTVGGQSVIAFGWEVGRTDPIDWHPWWTSVVVPTGGATATFFGPGGNIAHNHTPELVGPGGGAWNGVDTDNTLVPLGDLFSRVLIKYQVNPVPAPAALGVLGLGLGLAGRRRR